MLSQPRLIAQKVSTVLLLVFTGGNTSLCEVCHFVLCFVTQISTFLTCFQDWEDEVRVWPHYVQARDFALG